MKYLYALLGIIFFFLLSLLAQKTYFFITGRFYSLEHSSGIFSYVYLFILALTPLLGGLVGWKYSKNKKILIVIPFYFASIFLFYWYSSVYAGYPFFS